MPTGLSSPSPSATSTVSASNRRVSSPQVPPYFYLGSCQVFANPSRIYFKGSSSGVEVSRNATLIRLRELSYLTLLHRQDNGSIYSVSLHSNDPQAANLETILEEYVQIVDFYTLPVDS